MTQLEKLKTLVKEPGVDADEALLAVYLDEATQIIMSHRYPYGNWPTDEEGNPVLESQYTSLQVRVAEALYDKRGAEGEQSHSENGISRSYGTDGVPLSLLREIVPYATAVS